MMAIAVREESLQLNRTSCDECENFTKKEQTMPLLMVDRGKPVIIRKITGRDNVRQHLAELGLTVDSKVTVMNSIGGNLILQVKDSRIALDRKMAGHIMV